MDPLRFEAGEAEAFHPLVKLRKHTGYQDLRPAFPDYHQAVGNAAGRQGVSAIPISRDFLDGAGVEPASGSG